MPSLRNLARLGWLAGLAALVSTSGARAADLLVSSQTTNSVLRYDGATGDFLGVFASGGGIDDPLDLVIGPDTHLYVGSGRSNTVLRFDGRTGAFIGVFASGGGLDGPEGMAFGPDGNLYVCSSNTSSVMRFNGTTGAFLDAFVPAGSGGLRHPRAVAFGSDGNLYVLSYTNASVLRYDGRTGAFLGAFVPQGSGGLFTPSGMAFGVDGDLYVSGGVFGDNGVRRYEGRTGGFLGLFGRVPGYEVPIDVVFGPDGNLYVSTGGAMHGVLRFDGSCGTLVDAFVPDMSGGLANPFGIAFAGGSRSEPLPFVDLIQIRAKVPGRFPGLPICAGDSISVLFAGSFPNDCFRLRRIERIELFDDRMGPAPEPPIVRLVVDDGGCLGRLCPQVPVPWEAAIALAPLPARGYRLLTQLAQVSCGDSILPGNLYSTVVPFCVAPAESCPRPSGCVMGLWDHGDGTGACDAFVSPERPAKITFQVTSPVALAGLQGEFSVWEPGLRVVGMEPVGSAVGMRLNWTPTAAGARFVLFAEHGAPIPPGIAPVPVLRLTLAQSLAAPDSLREGPEAGSVFHLTTSELLGSDIDGGEVPYCVGAFPHIDFHPDVATICVERPCDFNADGSTDVRDLVLMVHCVNGSGPCPAEAAARFDCDANGRFDLSDVLCCAIRVLRGPDCPECPVDSTRTEPGVRVAFDSPRPGEAGVEVPLRILGADLLGAARLELRYPADRFRLAGVRLVGDPGSDWLELQETADDQVTIGLIRVGASLHPSLPLDVVLDLELAPGQSPRGEVSLADADFSGPDGVLLEVEIGEPRVSLGGPVQLSVSPAWPNPSSGETRFSVTLDGAARLEVAIYDVTGRRVAELFRGPKPSGSHVLTWNGRTSEGSEAREGIYFYRVVAGGRSATGKVGLIRAR